MRGVHGGDSFVGSGEGDGHAVEGDVGVEGGAVEARKVDNLQKCAIIRKEVQVNMDET